MQGGAAAGAAYESVRAWLAAWGDEVATVALGAARTRFAPDVVAFGTHADVVVGIDALHEEQWSRVWPNIADFGFLLDDLVVLASPDQHQAVAVVGWTSTGFAVDGTPFERPGRATIVLSRDDLDAPWYGTHTHLSLGRDVPATTHGRR